MSILRRLFLIARSYLNHAIGKVEDPEKMLNQMLVDMEEQLMDAKRQVALAIADEKKLLVQYQESKKKMDEWKKKAEFAVQVGRDDLARKALQRCSEYTQEAKNLEIQWKNQKNAVDKLRQALHSLNSKINDAKRKKNLLIARAKRAYAAQNISSTMSNLSGSKNTLQAIDRIELKIEKMEADANVASTMASEIDADELHAQFDRLELSSPDNELKKMKKQIEAKTSINLDKDKTQKITDMENDIENDKFSH